LNVTVSVNASTPAAPLVDWLFVMLPPVNTTSPARSTLTVETRVGEQVEAVGRVAEFDGTAVGRRLIVGEPCAVGEQVRLIHEDRAAVLRGTEHRPVPRRQGGVERVAADEREVVDGQVPDHAAEEVALGPQESERGTVRRSGEACPLPFDRERAAIHGRREHRQRRPAVE